MRRYTPRVDAGGLAASPATTYWGYLSGFLSYAVRDGLLDRNPALAERATEELPDDDRDGRDGLQWRDVDHSLSRATRRGAIVEIDVQGEDDPGSTTPR